MSKLAHSNDGSMLEIEMKRKGLRRIVRRKCEAIVNKNSTKTIQGQCTRYAVWIDGYGISAYCDLHAKEANQ